MADEINEHVERIQNYEDSLRHMRALREILMDSSEADIVRTATEALIGTTSGRAFLEMNPVVL